jgi:ABC-type transport system involved in multi-copper enzyme maturation permease subunit
VRPYLTIVKDAFREAMASKVLWVLLGFSTIFLLAVAPIGIEDRAATTIEGMDVRDIGTLWSEIERLEKADGPNPAKQLRKVERANLSDAEREAAKKDSAAHPPRGNIYALLNLAVETRDFYDSAAWKSYRLPEEATALIDQGVASLDEPQLMRLNRLLLEAAFPRSIAHAEMQSYLGYANHYWDTPLVLRKSFLLPQILAVFTEWFLGVGGVFAALLVSSSFIPRTFETGTVDLLLSKPVSRPLVFLAKFFGGCAFITLVAAYLIVGLYLIAGLRLGYWNQRFLLCVPLLLFLFSINYSVSALAGVLWRNAIISVVFALVFWLFCSLLGLTKSIFEINVLDSHRITEMVSADGVWFSRSSQWLGRHAGLTRWDEAQRIWAPVTTEMASETETEANWFETQSAFPVYEPKSRRLLSVGQERTLQGEVTGPWLIAMSKADEWRTRVIGKMVDTPRMLLPRGDGKLLDLTTAGILTVTADGPELTAKQRKELAAATTPDYVPPAGDWSLPLAAVCRPGGGELVAYDRGRLRIYTPDAKNVYKLSAEQAIADNPEASADALAVTANRIALGLADGRLLVFSTDGRTMTRLAQYEPAAKTSITKVAFSPNGEELVALTANREVWFYDQPGDADDEAQSLGTWDQGDVAAMAIDSEGQIGVAHDFNHVSIYRGPNDRIEKLTPQYDTFEAVYWYGVYPAYLALPKPGQLGKLSSYLLHGTDTVQATERNDIPAEKIDIQTPIWSNLAFLAIMLGIGCLYVSRKDF